MVGNATGIIINMLASIIETRIIIFIIVLLFCTSSSASTCYYVFITS